MDPEPNSKPPWVRLRPDPGGFIYFSGHPFSSRRCVMCPYQRANGATVTNPASSDSAASVRADVWLWAVRVFRTRSKAAAACSSGKVSVNGATAKPAKLLRVGDHVHVRNRGHERKLEVVELPTKRLGAPLAREAMVDHSLPPEPRPRASRPAASPAQREPGSGRPTKRDRRDIDRFRGR